MTSIFLITCISAGVEIIAIIFMVFIFRRWDRPRVTDPREEAVVDKPCTVKVDTYK
jgi:hypothetical protein